MYVNGNLTLNQSTITVNTSGSYGGGVFAIQGLHTINGSILANNDATLGGADFVGQFAFIGSGALPSANNSLIGDNELMGLAAAPIGAPDANGNLIGDSSGAGVIDPLLAPLADNGGPTQTHALLPGSPAIDAGDPSVLFDPMAFDQRGDGFFRVGDGGGGLRTDIGAYELQTTPPLLLGDYNRNGVVDAADYTVWRDALGQMVAPYSGADGDGDQQITRDDYDLWVANFGMTLPTPAAAESAVAAFPLGLSAESSADNGEHLEAGFALLGAPDRAPSPVSRVGFSDTIVEAPSTGDDLLLLLAESPGQQEPQGFETNDEALAEEDEANEDLPLRVTL